ncbi:hypothetical protein [Burkholderia territorii]|uniref:hypothetical protein n=1 Tax=Burkholderia territorii TaxID=1503055 RepID=UPI0012D9CF42|nr:hypothetical protein [Burkholderia territorii]
MFLAQINVKRLRISGHCEEIQFDASASVRSRSKALCMRETHDHCRCRFAATNLIEANASARWHDDELRIGPIADYRERRDDRHPPPCMHRIAYRKQRDALGQCSSTLRAEAIPAGIRFAILRSSCSSIAQRRLRRPSAPITFNIVG